MGASIALWPRFTAPMAERSPRPSRSRKGTTAAAAPETGAEPAAAAGAAALDPDWLEDVNNLRYQDARTALELAMAQLQAPELEVEEMAGLYRRAEAYAERCAAVLGQVEQAVIEWEAAADHGPG